MMFHAQGPLRNHCTLLAVLCGKSGEQKLPLSDDKPRYPLPELESTGRLEVCFKIFGL
jgi:hypothetical protein